MPPYSEQEANQMLADIINKYPAMQNVYDLNKTKVMYGTPERIIASKIHGGGGYLEYWPQEEEGLPQFPHPSPGNTVLEIYNQEIAFVQVKDEKRCAYCPYSGLCYRDLNNTI